MAISQSVECPLTTTDTVVIGGSLSTHNGKGQGSVSTVLRRVLSFRSWTEIEIIAGSGSSATVRYFRTFWSKGFMNLSGTFHVTRRGLRPGLSCVLGYQLRHNLMGRITWGAGINSFMNSTLVWENSRNALVGSVQLGLMASFVSLSYVRKFVEKEAKVRGAVKLGTFGIIVEYGCEKKVTQFSSVGASMAVGNTIGILLKIKLIRGNQTFLVPIHLAETPLVPSALIYGTFLPVVAYEVVKKLIVLPFMNDYKAKLLQAKKDANLKRMAEKKKEAEAAIDLMKESVDRCFEVEQARGGLVIKKALFGKLQGENVNDSECIDVSRPLQALVKDSRLFIPQGTELSQLPGFYDPCIGEVSELSIIYEFRRQRHVARFKQSDKILLPSRDHLNEDGYQKLPNERTESNS